MPYAECLLSWEYFYIGANSQDLGITAVFIWVLQEKDKK